MSHARKLVFLLILSLIVSKISAQNAVNIIPQPQEVILGERSFTINGQTKIYFQSENQSVAKQLQLHIQSGSEGLFELVETEKGKNGIIFKSNSDFGKEDYELIVSANGISITASGAAGWFYGMQTLKQLFPVDYENAATKLISIEIQAMKIRDTPRFSWRAFMLDESRYFKGKKQVKMLLDEMAKLKMNVFHWHLVDDQGWRIEIMKYPLLTEIGSKRKSTQVGPLKWQSLIQSAEPHEGFYTQEEIKEIVQYAADRQITVVPEIEMPGHSSAAIATYSWLGTAKNEIEVPIKFGVGPDVYDVSDPKVYKFLTDVLDEVMDLFPSKVIHIGGDEVRYNEWKESESVQA
ncbi:MAG: beta-N-acetylhexosaminidase, partial [Cyclobacteriaceae bacterium]|nr:beta-N-acetylhexosaminidase [Cyclobacteriaceae bacterium]